MSPNQLAHQYDRKSSDNEGWGEDVSKILIPINQESQAGTIPLLEEPNDSVETDLHPEEEGPSQGNQPALELASGREVNEQLETLPERRKKAAKGVAKAVREVAKRSGAPRKVAATKAKASVRRRKKSPVDYERKPLNTIPMEIKPEQMVLQGVNGNFNEIVHGLIMGGKIGEIAASLRITKTELHAELLPVMREFNARTPSHLIRKIIRKNLGQLPFADVDAQLPLSKKQLSVLQYLSFGGRAEHIAVAIAEKKPELERAKAIIRSLMKTFGAHTEAETVYKGFITGWLGPEDDRFVDDKEAKIRKIVENKFSVETDAQQ